ncbi:MAG: YkgJ family cysteine cluster protein [Desulfobulbus sp.]|nr:YkgJ family cysteine cluster protein [Desulfobulbus sp.]
MDYENLIPHDRERLGHESFQFHCHPDVPCFLSCCRNVDLPLYPYDIVLLKKQLGLTSSKVIERYANLCEGSHPYFPGLKLKLTEDAASSCPFLRPEGCSVYVNRPTACRTYPLERGIESTGLGEPLRIHYFLTHHPYCKGHFESRTYTVKQWERDQDLHQCNLVNDMWAELDAFFATNPWAGEGKAGPYQRLAFMACYNIDDFRVYLEQHNVLNNFRMAKDERRRIGRDDEALLQFGFRWLEFILGGRKKLVKK